jgi:hypothetical protein
MLVRGVLGQNERGVGTAGDRILYFSLALFGATAAVSMDCFLELLVEFAFSLITEGFAKGARPIMRDLRDQKNDGFTLLRLTTASDEGAPRPTFPVSACVRS